MNIKTLGSKFYDYSTFIKGYSKDTLKRYKTVINMFCNFSCITEVEEVNEENSREFFYYGRMQKKWGANTFISYHKSLNVFFRWCCNNGYMEKNFMEDIECPKLEKKLPPKLTKQEAMRLMEVAYNYPYKYKFLRYRNYAIFATFLHTGIRKKELLNLKYSDLDLENRVLFVRQGKGSKDRVIPLSYKIVEILERYLVERKRLHKTCPEFFVSLNRNMGFKDIGLKRLVIRMRDASGLKFSVHKLRHTFATLMLEGGCDIFSLSKMMGHNDLKTTAIYLSASAEHLRSEIGKHPLNEL